MIKSTTKLSFYARRVTILVASVLVILTGLSGADRLRAQTGTTAYLNSLVEIQLPFTERGSNPYDPAQISVTGTFTAPSGRNLTIPGFWYQPYGVTNGISDPYLNLNPTGEPGWRLRFSPDEVGTWTYKVQVSLEGSVQTITEGQIDAQESDRPGKIRVGTNPHYFAYNGGGTYFPVGLNLGWSWDGANGATGYLGWLAQLQQVGANYARLYVDTPWFIGLDWESEPGDYTAGQEDLYRLDAIIQAAESRGIALQVVLLWHQGYASIANTPVNIPQNPPRPTIDDYTWFNNPLSAGRGGPIPNSAAFFSTEAGRDLFRQRLRYFIARYSYSSSIFAWEVIDQLDNITLQAAEVATEWITAMVDYVRITDPYRHLITAGVGDYEESGLLATVALDFRQFAYYHRRPIEDAPDQAATLLQRLAPVLLNADRPLLVNEFSLNPWFEPKADDPTGAHLRETIWTAALSGTAGGAMTWYWDTYVLPDGLISILEPLANFTRGLDFANGDFAPVEVAFDSIDATGLAPYTIEGFTGNYNRPPGTDVVYRVTPDGISPSIAEQSGYIYGTVYNSQFSRPQRYIITPPVDTTLKINVFRSSEQAEARLVVLIDGRTAAEMTLNPGNRNVSLTVPITAGEHNVLIDNLGPDFLQLESIEIGAYVTPLRTLALADKESGVFVAWIQHRDYTWQNAANAESLQPIAARLKTQSLPPGVYNVELWDVFTGNIVGQEQITVPVGGMFAVDLLPVSHMSAIRAVRVAEFDGVPDTIPTPIPTPRIP